MFQDKEGYETNKGDENIPENLAGDRTAGRISAGNLTI